MPELFLSRYLSGLSELFEHLDREAFGNLVTLLDQTRENQASIYIFGNGGSAATASHFVCDLNKGASYGRKKKFNVVCLNDNTYVTMAYANDVSYEEIFVEQLKNCLKKNDLVIGVSGSGNSPNVIKAIEYANQQAVKTIGICGFDGGRLKQTARYSLWVQSHDMQKVEDIHAILFHCAAQWFMVREAEDSE